MEGQQPQSGVSAAAAAAAAGRSTEEEAAAAVLGRPLQRSKSNAYKSCSVCC
jgi:hypothetical protein